MRRIVFLYFDNFYSLILADYIVIYLPCIIIRLYGNFLEYITVTSHFLQRKLHNGHNTTSKIDQGNIL